MYKHLKTSHIVLKAYVSPSNLFYAVELFRDNLFWLGDVKYFLKAP